MAYFQFLCECASVPLVDVIGLFDLQDFRESVNKASQQSGKPVIEERLLNQILYYLPQLYELNQNLLLELKQRVTQWYKELPYKTSLYTWFWWECAILAKSLFQIIWLVIEHSTMTSRHAKSRLNDAFPVSVLFF